ncbi:Ppx/GppA phosphatase family protein [Nakamurella lactea]|uniref:Ppx/GppA phosphatase family protein n=1 Tax=Nakamurella lactea TaxID=459515 RepID=UPI0003F7328C|nr:Ppx/GppA phosphatase family protein [Nakamurella lactea]
MRLGVLDVGSNTVHLLVVDAHRGGHPTPQLSQSTGLRLAEHLDDAGILSDQGKDALLAAVGEAAQAAARLGCAELLAFATSAVRDASNASDVLDHVRTLTGVDLQVLPGPDEARLTFLAARRWYGWSAGNLLVLDIGGGSLEIAAGKDEEPEVALSLPLGAGRLHRDRQLADPPSPTQVGELKEWLTERLAAARLQIKAAGPFDRVVATSKTFRTLARLTGAAPSSAGPRVQRVLTAAGLRQVSAFLQRMTAADIACLEGVSPNRAPQIPAGALIAEAAVTALGLSEVEICPWALREGVILRRLDQLAFGP